jgi:hypothetical protein
VPGSSALGAGRRGAATRPRASGGGGGGAGTGGVVTHARAAAASVEHANATCGRTGIEHSRAQAGSRKEHINTTGQVFRPKEHRS